MASPSRCGQLLDPRGGNTIYGVPAFNINNMEQALAIMDAASSLDAPVIIQASRGARSYANDIMLRHMMDGRHRDLSADPGLRATSTMATPPATCMTAIQAGFTSVMMERLAEGRRQDRRRLGTTMSGVNQKPSPDMAHLGGISVEGRTWRAGVRWETGMGDKEGWPRAREGKLSHDQFAHQSRRSGEVR